MSIDKEECMKGLFKKATQEKLWFYNERFDVLFSPKELKERQKDGLYNTDSWRLVDPKLELDKLLKRKKELIKNIDKQIANFEKRMK